MKVLITGAKGFVGRNLCAALRAIRQGSDRRPDHAVCADPAELELYEYDLDCEAGSLDSYCADCNFVFHLAGVNRPVDEKAYMEGNAGCSAELLNTLKKHGNTCPVMLASSAQATLEGRWAGSEYGKSKRAAEELFFAYGRESGAPVLVYRFPNLFGKWCRPNYHSAIATFCHNSARGLPIQVSDPAVVMDLVYIDDLVDEMLRALRGEANRQPDGFCAVPVHHVTTLGQIADTILSFPALREKLEVPRLDDPLEKKLYSTWLSHLPEDRFVYDLKMNCDRRGSFTETLRTAERGQCSVSVSAPGVTRGEHWHHTKNEKVLVVHGTGLIRLRRLGEDKVVEFRVSGRRMQVVELVPGYTHSIVNLSDTEELVALIWANEPFDPARPDTFFEEV